MQPWKENRLLCAWQCHLAVKVNAARRQGGDQGDKMDVSDTECRQQKTLQHPLESHITLTNRNRCSNTFVPEPKNALGRILFIRNVYE